MVALITKPPSGAAQPRGSEEEPPGPVITAGTRSQRSGCGGVQGRMLPAWEPHRLVQRQPELLHKGGFLRERSMKSSPEPEPSERASPVRSAPSTRGSCWVAGCGMCHLWARPDEALPNLASRQKNTTIVSPELRLKKFHLGSTTRSESLYIPWQWLARQQGISRRK